MTDEGNYWARIVDGLASQATENAVEAAYTVTDAIGRFPHALRVNVCTSSEDGGVFFYFYGKEVMPNGAHRLFADIECTPDGDILAYCRDRQTGEDWMIENDIDDALHYIHGFLSALPGDGT